jgi:hypothetical protein
MPFDFIELVSNFKKYFKNEVFGAYIPGFGFYSN